MHYSSNVKKKNYYYFMLHLHWSKYFLFSPPFPFLHVAPLASLFTSLLFVSCTQIFPLPPPCLTHPPNADLVNLSFPFHFFFLFFLHSTIPNLFSLKHLYLNSITILKLIKSKRLKKKKDHKFDPSESESEREKERES